MGQPGTRESMEQGREPGTQDMGQCGLWDSLGQGAASRASSVYKDKQRVVVGADHLK